MLETNYLEYPASIQEAMGMRVDYAKLFPIYIAKQTGEGVISVTSDKQVYTSGSTFYLTILLEEGYELEELSVVDNNDNEIELTKESETELSDGSIEIIMFGIMGTSAAFAQAAGRAGKGEPVGKIILDTQFADPTISSISCTGEIKVTTIKNGAPLVETYTDLDGETLSIQADANTQIIISGAEITACEVGTNTTYTKISVKNTALTQLNCYSCYALTALDVSKNTALITLDCGDCAKLVSISYPATNEDVSTSIAGAITAATAADGTVYTDSEGAYYSTIADAATAKGWTIEQL